MQYAPTIRRFGRIVLSHGVLKVANFLDSESGRSWWYLMSSLEMIATIMDLVHEAFENRFMSYHISLYELDRYPEVHTDSQYYVWFRVLLIYTTEFNLGFG